MKRLSVILAALASIALMAGSAQSTFKNKRMRPVTIKLQKELTLGEQPSKKEALFQAVRSFRVDGKGSIFVLDSKALKLLKFSGTGELLFSVGRKGQGPGEFMAPAGIELGKGGSVLIYDVGNHRLSYLSADTGQLLEEISTSKWPRIFRIDDDSQGNFYGYQILYDQGKVVRIISKFSPALDLITETFRVEDSIQENEIQMISPNLFFRVLDDDNVLVAKSSPYTFYWYNSAGRLVRTVDNTYSPVLVSAAYKERARKAYSEGPRNRQDQTLAFPKYYPPIEHLITDDKGNIFVRHFEEDASGRHYYDAFSREGKSLGTFPLEFPIFCAVGDKLYSLETDDRGFNQICWYRYKIIR